MWLIYFSVSDLVFRCQYNNMTPASVSFLNFFIERSILCSLSCTPGIFQKSMTMSSPRCGPSRVDILQIANRVSFTYGCALVPVSCRWDGWISGRPRRSHPPRPIAGQPHGVYLAAIENFCPALPRLHGLIRFKPAGEQ